MFRLFPLKKESDIGKEKIFSRCLYFNGDGECDFVVSEGDVAKRLIQVSWEMSDDETRGREFSGILEAAHATGCRDLVIVTRDEEGEEMHSGLTVQIVPICKFLLSK